MQRGKTTPEAVIDIKRIANLSKIEINGNGSLSIGPLVTFSDILANSILREKYPVLYQSARVMGTTQIRNRATIGGNICSGSPSGDSILPLICLGAQLRLSGQKGERWVPLKTLYEDPPKTSLLSDELLSEIRVPLPHPRTLGIYSKVDLRICVLVTLSKNRESLEDARILLGPVAQTPIRCKQAEKTLKGKAMSESLFEDAAQMVQEEIEPLFDRGAIAEYPYEMAYVFTKRALKACLMN